jgi:hypothetical protein
VANIVEIVIKGIDRTKDGFTSPIKSLKDLEVAAGKVAPLFIGIATAAEAAFIAMAKHFINTADEMGKMAQKAGTTTETFSRMAYAGNLAGVSAESLKNGFKFLNQQLVEANQGSPETLQLFKDLGITSRDSATAIAQIAQRFSETEDNADKTTAAVKLFGKAGADMIPLLNAGADGLKAMSEESDAFHQTISKDTAKSAEEFNDNLTRLKSLTQGFVNVIVMELLPGLSDWSSWAIKVAKDSDTMTRPLQTVIDGLKILAYVAGLVVTGLKMVHDWLVVVGDLFSNVLSNAIDFYKIFFDGAEQAGLAMIEMSKGHFGTAKTMFKEALDGMKFDFENFRAGIKVTGGQLKDDIKSFYENTAKNAIMTLPLPNFGPSGKIKGADLEHTATTKGKIILSDPDAAKKSLEDDKNFLKANQLEREMIAEQLSGIAQVVAQEQNRYELRLEQIAKLTLTEGQAMELEYQAHKAHTAALKKLYTNELVQGVSGAFGNMAAAAQAFGKKGFAAFKAFATAQALVNTYSSAVGAYNAMASIPFVGPALAVAAAAAAIAAGLANVAQINSTQPAGAAHGGLDFVPSEQTYLLDRGERVLSPKQNEDFTSFIQGGAEANR